MGKMAISILPNQRVEGLMKGLMTSGIKIILKNQMNVVENSEFPDKELGYVFYTPNGLCWKEKSRSIQIIY